MIYLFCLLLTSCGTIDSINRNANVNIVPGVTIKGSTEIPFYFQAGDSQCFTFHTKLVITLPRSIYSTQTIPASSIVLITIKTNSIVYYPNSLTFTTNNPLTYNVEAEDVLCVSSNTAGYEIYGTFETALTNVWSVGPVGPSIWDH